MENWFMDKIPKKENIVVQYTNSGNLIAISTRDGYTGEFKMYKVDNEDKSLLLLGKGKDPSKLENKFLKTIKKPYGYAIKEDK